MLGVISLLAATCSDGVCLGQQEVTAGNCQTHRLPPLSAFGSLSLNSIENPNDEILIPLKAALMLANTLGQEGNIFIAKSILTQLLITRTPGTPFFIANQRVGRICVNNFGYNTPNLTGYVLLAAALITEWELEYESTPLWVQLPVLGADDREYQIADFIDFLWRDVHNPFHDDPDFPYDRYILFAHDFDYWYGMNAFARAMLKISLNDGQRVKYEAVKEFSEAKLSH